MCDCVCVCARMHSRNSPNPYTKTYTRAPHTQQDKATVLEARVDTLRESNKVLMNVAVCCSVLQRVAVCYSVLQCVALSFRK